MKGGVVIIVPSSAPSPSMGSVRGVGVMWYSRKRG